MPITLSERMESRGFELGATARTRWRYIARGTADHDALATYLNANIPESDEDLVLESITAEPVTVDSVADTGTWDIEATYISPAYLLDHGESSESFDTTGGTQHITTSRSTRSRTMASGTAPNLKNVIGLSGDTIEGVDITVPAYQFEITQPFAYVVITEEFKGNLFNLTGTVNDGAFKGFAAGEVLFLGARGRRRGLGSFDVSYQFAALPNRTDIAVGDITVPAKNGWEYLWILFEDSVDQDTLIKVPKAAYVERVYAEADFSLLGIGV